MGDLTALSATQAARLIAQGGLKPSDLLRAYLARIDSREHEIKAFEHITSESALAYARQQDQQTAKGLLFGIPIGVKDLIDTKGMTTTYGSAIYRNHIPQADAACVTQARRQGAIVLGKTVTTEFAVFHPGKTANPHDTGRTPGGSSSGSAAAVASRMVPLAFGTQTAASVYRPASFCGVVGFKPTYGTIAKAGTKPLADSLDTIGLLANSVQDAALFASAVASRADLLIDDHEIDQNAPRVGVCKTYEWSHAQPETQEAVDSCARLLASRGAMVSECVFPAEFKDLLQAQINIMAKEAAMSLSAEYENFRDLLSAKLIEVIEQGLNISDDQLRKSYAVVSNCRCQLKDVFTGYDMLLAPAARGEAPVGLAATGDPVFSRIWTALGNPGVVIPWSKGPSNMPVGVLLTGLHFNDGGLLRAACWAEHQRGGMPC